MMEGDWKLIGQGDKPPLLFNIAADREETTDLAKDHPERLAAMQERFAAWDEDWKQDLLSR
ncbi:MAG: hypothetical protein AAFR11_02065 [Pseudomonadota bacterium]